MLGTPGESPFYAQGLRFSCIRCSACCRHDSGYVFLSENDVSMLGKALNMEFKELSETYCRWIPSPENGKEQLSLKEKSNYDCIFWSGSCSVYETRPLQCRAFPFWQSVLASRELWKLTAQSCPGMDQGVLHSPDSVKKWLAVRQNEPIISRSSQVKGDF